MKNVQLTVFRTLRFVAPELRRFLGLFMVLVALALALAAVTSNALATGDDISTATTTISGYWDAIKVIAIAVVLFVIGRKVLKKI